MRYRALIVAFLAVCLGLLTACGGDPDVSSGPLTYEDIRGTGLANKCPQLDQISRGSIKLESGVEYTISELCLEPTSFYVKEEPSNKRQEARFVKGKALTRYTNTIDQVSGTLTTVGDGSVTFAEKDGFDFQATTVLLPGGEQVPFLFTIKGLVATASSNGAVDTSTDFEGEFRVPSYRTSNFLDPKGRGLATGYDNAVALPAQADDEELLPENVKSFETGTGQISLQVAKVNSATGEIAGTFVSVQPSDTDMGSDDPVDVKIEGIFYGRIEA